MSKERDLLSQVYKELMECEKITEEGLLINIVIDLLVYEIEELLAQPEESNDLKIRVQELEEELETECMNHDVDIQEYREFLNIQDNLIDKLKDLINRLLAKKSK
jgi:hypothetical protein